MTRPVHLAGFLLLALTIFFTTNCFAEPYLDQDTLKKYLQARDHWKVRLSPDGRHISALTKKDGRNTLVVLDLETPLQYPELFLLAADGRRMDYQWYPDEGHGNALLENRIDAWQRIERFLRHANGPVSE